MSPFMAVVSTWIQRGVLLLGIIKAVEIALAFLGSTFGSNLNTKESGKSILKFPKHSEKGFLYQSLKDVKEIKLTHGPRDSVVRKRPLLEPLAIPHIVGFAETVIPPGSSVERHIHLSKYETFFCKEGQGYINIGRTEESGSEDEVLELIPGSCVTVVPQFYHSLHNNGTKNLVLLYFGVAC